MIWVRTRYRPVNPLRKNLLPYPFPPTALSSNYCSLPPEARHAQPRHLTCALSSAQLRSVGCSRFSAPERRFSARYVAGFRPCRRRRFSPSWARFTGEWRRYFVRHSSAASVSSCIWIPDILMWTSTLNPKFLNFVTWISDHIEMVEW